ncbi:MAG: tetratricopeptide repeat protein [Rikenellaceae bacterium]
MNQQNNASANSEQMEQTLSKTEQFFTKNAKNIAIGASALLFVVVAFFGYKSLVVEPREKAAADAMFYAQAALEAQSPNFRIALEGDEQFTGFLEVADSYGSTAAGNLAAHYAGICYLNLGELDNALEYLSKYKAQDGIAAGIINAQNLGLQGDIKVDLGDYSAAVALFEAAVAASSNNITAPIFLVKAGLAAQAADDDAKAKELYEKSVKLYPSSSESRTAQKYIGTLQSK